MILEIFILELFGIRIVLMEFIVEIKNKMRTYFKSLASKSART